MTDWSALDAVIAEAALGDSLDQLGAYIGRQRWSGAQDTSPVRTEIVDAALLEREDAVLLFTACRVSFADSRTREYALPLGLRPAGDALAERAPNFMISLARDDGRILYDALGDPRYIHWMWRAIREERTVPTARGALRCVCPDPARLEDSDAPAARVLTVEQSNTSVEIGIGTFLKHLRRIEPGPSQELEMTTALTAAGFPHIAPMLAHVLYERDGDATAPLVLVQPFLRNTADGWALALTSLRDLYSDTEEALARGDTDAATVVAGQGGSFVGEASRLGQVIAEMHGVLAGLTAEDMRAAPIDAATLTAWSRSMHEDLDRLLAQDAAALAPLRAYEGAVRAAFDAVRTLAPGGLRIRIHGDLHLGQTLRTDSGWVILDFEGEPNRTPAERRQLSSPLRDVAGMLRSFDYAAAVALTERVLPESSDWDGYMRFGDHWAAQNRTAFWSAYAESLVADGVLPATADAAVLLRAFEVQKAVYEVGYELAHRPTWVTIPMRYLMQVSDAGR